MFDDMIRKNTRNLLIPFPVDDQIGFKTNARHVDCTCSYDSRINPDGFNRCTACACTGKISDYSKEIKRFSDRKCLCRKVKL